MIGTQLIDWLPLLCIYIYVIR